MNCRLLEKLLFVFCSWSSIFVYYLLKMITKLWIYKLLKYKEVEEERMSISDEIRDVSLPNNALCLCVLLLSRKIYNCILAPSRISCAHSSLSAALSLLLDDAMMLWCAVSCYDDDNNNRIQPASYPSFEIRGGKKTTRQENELLSYWKSRIGKTLTNCKYTTDRLCIPPSPSSSGKNYSWMLWIMVQLTRRYQL